MALLANAWFRGKEHPQAFTIEDFLGTTPKSSDGSAQTVEQQMALIGTLFQHWQGLGIGGVVMERSPDGA
jgi:hypothetical protein